MRLVYGVFSITYEGRGYTFRDPAERLLIIKNDGSVAIHNDNGYKPLNYMTGPTEIIVSGNHWSIQSKTESISIDFLRIYSDNNLEMEEDKVKVIREGTEAHLQKWLYENLSRVAPSLDFVDREFETGEGPVDILAFDHVREENVLVEVKRNAGGPAVAQVNRYLKAYEEQDYNVRGLIIALDFNPRSLVLAAKHDIDCVIVPKELYEFGKHDNNTAETILKDLLEMKGSGG